MSLIGTIIGLLIGTYGEQIYKINVDGATFEILGCDTISVENASYLAFSDNGAFLFALSESGEGSKLTSFRMVGGCPKVSELAEGVAPDPCFLLWHKGCLLTADYTGGSVSVYPVTPDGVIQPARQVVKFHCSGPNKERQPYSHIHMLKIYGDRLYASDLGGDRIHVLAIGGEASGFTLDHISDIRTAPGTGPRHFDISADGRYMYVLTELSSEIYVIRDGETIQKLYIGDRAEPVQAGGDIHLSPDGRFLYASLRNGADKIVAMTVADDGTISRSGDCATALHCRNFVISSDGLQMIVPCKNSNVVQLFGIDPSTGVPFDTGRSFEAQCPVLALPVKF